MLLLFKKGSLMHAISRLWDPTPLLTARRHTRRSPFSTLLQLRFVTCSSALIVSLAPPVLVLLCAATCDPGHWMTMQQQRMLTLRQHNMTPTMVTSSVQLRDLGMGIMGMGGHKHAT